MIELPKLADLESDPKQIIIKFKPSQFDKVRWFRKWCRKNGKHMNNILYEKIEEYAKKHNYPYGHSQTEIAEFKAGPLNVKKEPVLHELCRHSHKELSDGLFYCMKVHGWCLPKACGRCKYFRKDKK